MAPWPLLSGRGKLPADSNTTISHSAGPGRPSQLVARATPLISSPRTPMTCKPRSPMLPAGLQASKQACLQVTNRWWELICDKAQATTKTTRLFNRFWQGRTCGYCGVRFELDIFETLRACPHEYCQSLNDDSKELTSFMRRFSQCTLCFSEAPLSFDF